MAKVRSPIESRCARWLPSFGGRPLPAPSTAEQDIQRADLVARMAVHTVSGSTSNQCQVHGIRLGLC